MASLNKVQLIGHLGADPEARFMPDGTAVSNLRIATTETWKDKTSGEKKEATEWHRVVFFGKLGEIANQYLKKGSQVYIEGKLTTRKWQDKDGQDRYTTEIKGDEMKMLGGRGDGQGQANGSSNGGQQQRSAPQQRPAQSGGGVGNAAPAPAAAGNFEDDDIPFAGMHMEYDPAFNKAFGRAKRIVV